MVLKFASLLAGDTSVAGGKGASLARMSAAGFPVPPGFVICAAAFREFLDAHHSMEFVTSLTSGLDVNDSHSLEQASRQLRTAILCHPIPERIAASVRESYGEIGGTSPVAVRSSAVCEDGEAASFAGQQVTFLNVRGAGAVTRSVRECWASFFAPGALFYRARKGALSDTGMAVVVQQMASGEKSGVMFTMDPVARRRDRIVIEAVFGLGEGIVSGLITPDHYELDRDGGGVVREFIAVQTRALVQDFDRGGTRQIELTEEQGRARVLGAPELEDLRRMGLRLEEFFGRPQDIEWSIRGRELLLLQSRPITTI